MSTIQKLRSKTGLITIFIGAALLAFVVTGLDPQMFSSITGNQNVIAEINGKEYPYESYAKVLNRLQSNLDPNSSEIQKEAVYPRAWDAFVARHVYDDIYHEIGLGVFNPWLNIIGVSQTEFEDIMVGENIAPEVRNAEIFKNPQTNQFDKEILINTLSNLSQIRDEYPEFYMQWLDFETGMHQKLLETKLNNLVAKSFYPTALEVEMQIAEKSEKVDFEAVKIEYFSISDSLFTVSDSEIKDYFDKHKHEEQYQQEQSVSFDYVTFPIQPTQEDVENEVIYSSETRKDVYSKARYFASENVSIEQFNQSVIDNPEIAKRTAVKIDPNQRYVPGLEDSRDVIRWAYESRENAGQVSNIFNCGDAFVVAVVTDVYKEGVVALDEVKDDITQILLHGKKTEYVAKKIAALPESASIDQIAAEFKLKPVPVKDVTFAQNAAAGIGTEPKVIATATQLESGTISEPIEGSRAIFVVSVTSKTENTSLNPDQEKQMIISSRRMIIINSLFDYLKEKADIEDNRMRFL
jgi:hypothetical protein